MVGALAMGTQLIVGCMVGAFTVGKQLIVWPVVGALAMGIQLNVRPMVGSLITATLLFWPSPTRAGHLLACCRNQCAILCRLVAV